MTKKLIPTQKAAKTERQKKHLTVFMNGEQEVPLVLYCLFAIDDAKRYVLRIT